MSRRLVTDHAIHLRAGRAASAVLADLERLAQTAIAERLTGEPLQFRLLHGDIDDADQAARLQQLLDVAGNAVALIRGTNDRTDWYLDPDCPATLCAMDGLAQQIAPSWWRWTLDGTDPAVSR